MVEYNKLLYEIAVRFAANYLCQAKTAHIKERSQMLECYEFIALHKPSEQLSSVSGWRQQAFTLWFVWIRVQQQPVLKVSKYIQHFITNKPRRASEIVHLQQFTREYRSGGGGLGYNRYISTLSDVSLAFLLIYGLLRSRRRRRRRASARKFFWRFSATSHSLTHLLTHSLTRAVALSSVLFSAVVTKASNFVANFKQIFRFALPLFVLSHSLSMLLFRLLCAKSAF